MVILLGVGASTEESRGVSTAVGYVIILTIVLASVTVLAGLGSTALGDTLDRSEQDLAEHSMTLLDSRTAMVALGTSDTQSLSFSHDAGSVETRPDAGWLEIEHIDYTEGETETVFNDSLGAFVYANGDTQVAYQGGGVWRLGADGDTRMLSPPEFHYRGATLTLPVVRVAGTADSATSPRTTIRSSGTRAVFPNATDSGGPAVGAPYNATNDPYENPIENGRVEIKIKTPYYEGWASYARERTSANVTVYESNETVRLALESIAGSPGDFDVPLEGDSLEVSGLESGHPITDFSLTLTADGNFQNAHWSLYSTDNGDEFEMHIYSPSQCSNGNYDDDLDFSLYYYNDSTDEARQWQNPTITPGPDSAFDVDCETQELSVNFTDTNTRLTYQDIAMTGSNNKWCFGDHIEDRRGPDPVDLTQHPSVDPDSSFTKGADSATMNFTVNHYMSRMGPEFDLTVTDGAGNSECLSGGSGQGSSNVDESQSSGEFNFKESADSRFLTYLHVTENRVEFDLD